MKSSLLLYISCFLCSFCFGFLTATAQPSGGPYGPIQQKYDLPDVAGKIYYVAPDAKTEASGETLDKPTTLEKAITRVKTGDAIVLRGGIYRTGNLVLNQGITMQPYNDERPILKGTYIANEWEDLGNGLWTTNWSRLFPSEPDDWWRRHREGKKTPLYRFNNDMVFVDGKFLQAVGWEGEVDENTYYIDYDAGVVYIGIDPTNRLVEITAFDAALIRTTKDVHGKKSDRRGPIIRGITFTQYAYRAFEIEGYYPQGLSNEADHGKDVVGTTLEHCTITFCSRVAGYFMGDSLTIRNCKVSDTSTEGIYIISSSDVLLEKNILTRNNIERITGYYPAAVKIFNQSYRVTCNDNLVTDLPYSNGIWYDVGNVDGVFINNWVENVGSIYNKDDNGRVWYPQTNGFFFEISKGAVCAGNIFVDCTNGIMVLNASDVEMYNNTFRNSRVSIARTERSAVGDHFGWHPSTGPDIDERDGHVFVNNLLTADEGFTKPLLFVWQRELLCDKLTQSQLKTLDHNVYVRKVEKATSPLVYWSPTASEKCYAEFESLNGLRKMYPDFAKNSLDFYHYNGPLFKSRELGNYQLMKDFLGSDAGVQLPSEVSKLLGQSKRFVGAYPLVQ